MADAPNPDHYAVVFGIRRYPQFRMLEGAVNDAERFAAWLQREDGGGLPGAKIKLMTSPPDSFPVDIYQGLPNINTVKEALDAIQIRYGLKNKIRIGKRIYFYFSGHGVGNVLDDVGMLLPVTDPEMLTPNIGLRLYREFFRLGSFFDEAIYILDCCRDFRPKFAGQAPPDYDDPIPPADFKPTKEFVIMAAAWGAEAFQIGDGKAEDRRGVLTDALLDGLDGAQGAVDERGFVTTKSLARYLNTEVPRRATIAQLRQRPDVGQPLDDIILAVIPENKLKKTLVQITLPPHSIGTLRLLRSNWSEIASRPFVADADGVAWEINLLRGAIYVIEHVDTGLQRPIDLTTRTDERICLPFKVQ